MGQHRIDVTTASAAYACHVGTDLLGHVGEIAYAAAGGSSAFMVGDTTTLPLYGPAVRASLERAGYAVAEAAFPAGEASKRLSTLEGILEKMAEAELDRDAAVVAVGGGVTGDMAGLAAALYQRGISVIQVPTSLLAMIDSSVGGKTAVDLPQGKNLVGAFWQPAAVVADISCLATLSPELFRDSCGEAIKHAVLADPELFAELERHPLTESGRTLESVAGIVARNIEIKRDVVSADEHEHGIRQTLNLGHTIGHAVEAASDYRLGHGSCVAIGLCCIARAGERLGWTEAGVAERIERAVSAHGLPTDTGLSHDTLMRYAVHDKKRHGGSVNIVVPVRIGAVETRTVPIEELAEIVSVGCGTGERR